MTRAAGMTAAISIAATAATTATAQAQRPAPGDGYEAGTELVSHAPPDSLVRIWYVTTTADAPPLADEAPADGIPDYVATAASVAGASLARFAELGFRPPIADADHMPAADAGGDGLFDIYLVDMVNSDGSLRVDGCVAGTRTCFGHALVENDFAGFNYSSPELGLKTVVSHELFHGIQNAYDADQDSRWTEGTAVWAQELVFPESSDFERLIAAFLAKPDRPFDRATGAAFGDPYPYGAALFPAFLAERYGVDRIRQIWEGSAAAEGRAAEFLEVLADQLEAEGQSLAGAFEEFTRWNLLTGSRADPSRSYASGAVWAEVALEPLIDPVELTSVETEGLSARYLPLALGSVDGPLELVMTAEIGPLPRATLYSAGGAVIGEAVPLAGDTGRIAARLDQLGPGDGFLLVSGVSPGSPARTIDVQVAPPSAGGCSAAGSPPMAPLFLLVFFFLGQSLLALRHHQSPRDRRAYLVAFAIAVPGAFVSFLFIGT